jgi:hypothetical protein
MEAHDSKTPAELERLAQEIGLLREQAMTISSALLRIEKRLKLVFPGYEKRSTKNRPSAPGAVSNKTREELMALFGQLSELTRTGGDSAFWSKINGIPAEDLAALAFELGVSEKKKIGAKQARDRIRRRVQESLLLSSKVGSS